MTWTPQICTLGAWISQATPRMLPVVCTLTESPLPRPICEVCYGRGFITLWWHQSSLYTVKCRKQWYFLVIIVEGKPPQIYSFEKLLGNVVTNPWWHLFFTAILPYRPGGKSKYNRTDVYKTLLCLYFMTALAKEACFLTSWIISRKAINVCLI